MDLDALAEHGPARWRLDEGVRGERLIRIRREGLCGSTPRRQQHGSAFTRKACTTVNCRTFRGKVERERQHIGRGALWRVVDLVRDGERVAGLNRW